MGSRPELSRDSALRKVADVLARLDDGSVEPKTHAEVSQQLEQLRAQLAALNWTAIERDTSRSPGALRADDDHDRPLTPSPSGSASAELIERLQANAPKLPRYRVNAEIGRGGMGVVWRAYDLDLRRSLAMKVALESPAGDARQRERTVRFLEEAQLTGQLDHPCIVPVHELGVDSQGRLYFTMRLVRGRELGVIFGCARRGEDGWNLTRVLGVLLRVCEALSYAHSKGVIHRDLKPSNVMVGRFGEVYVMDWGLAKVMGRAEPAAARAKESVTDSQGSQLDLVRLSERRADPTTSVVTMDGTVLGTPSYMSPEQARGEIDALDERSDVYSVGAMLYQLLAGSAPYRERDAEHDPQRLWMRILRERPTALARVAPDAPQELVAICERAMAVAARDRYASVAALAEDLRAYLEGRVVRVYETGALAEARKWVHRNPGFAATAAALILGTTGGSLALALQQQRLGRERELASDERLATALVLEGEQPKRFERGSMPAVERWLADAEALLTRHVGIESESANRVEASDSPSDGSPHPGALEFARLLARLSGESGRIADAQRHRERMLEIERDSVGSDEARARWRSAIDSISDREQCPAYVGLVLTPQFGLTPIGRGPASGLWEFAFLPTGNAPERDPTTGVLRIDEESAVVLVLAPGGVADLHPSAGHMASAAEQPPVTASAAPSFLAKHELTQAQWLRMQGSNPSRIQPGTIPPELEGRYERPGLHPVELISAYDCDEILGRFGLRLPTDAEWACIAVGERTPSARERLLAHDPVDARLPNELGFHGLFDNVGEWCRTATSEDAEGRPLPAYVTRGTPQPPPRDPSARRPPPKLPWERDPTIGVRAARSIDP
jgi:serine/threonine protein kinase